MYKLLYINSHSNVRLFSSSISFLRSMLSEQQQRYLYFIENLYKICQAITNCVFDFSYYYFQRHYLSTWICFSSSFFLLFSSFNLTCFLLCSRLCLTRINQWMTFSILKGIAMVYLIWFITKYGTLSVWILYETIKMRQSNILFRFHRFSVFISVAVHFD